MTRMHQTRDPHGSWRKRDVAKWCSLFFLILCVVAWIWSSARACRYSRERYYVSLNGGMVFVILEPQYYDPSPLTGLGLRFTSGTSFDLGLTMPVCDVSRVHVADDDTVEEPRHDGSDHWTANIMLPMWIITLPLALVTAWLWYRARPTIPLGHCAKCGYDLQRIKSARCPECGTEIIRPIPSA